MRTRLTLVLSVVTVSVLTAQSPQDRNQPTFRGGANYVRVDMYATRDGEAIQDLEASELEVLENGVPQKIEDFEHVVVREAGARTTRREVNGIRESRDAAADPRSRVFIVFLDTYHTQIEGSTIMRKPLAAFLERLSDVDADWAARTKREAARGRVLRYVVAATPRGVSARLVPVPADSPIGALHGTRNLIAFTTMRYHKEPLIVSGPGAGAEVTAAGILNDIYSLSASAAVY